MSNKIDLEGRLRSSEENDMVVVPSDRVLSASALRESIRRRARYSLAQPWESLSTRQIFECVSLALLWQIYSRRCSLQIHFRQCGHRCFGGSAISSRMA